MTSLNKTIFARKGSPRETAAGAESNGSSSSQGAAPAAVSGGVVERLLLEDAARDLATQIDSIRTRKVWMSWRNRNQSVLAAVCRLLPECPARRALTTAGRTAKEFFDRSARRAPAKRSKGQSP